MAPSGLPPSARLVRACAKCHERKVKCDGTLPRCSNCARAGVQCNVAECVLWTHAHVTALEARVRWLEQLVSRAYELPEDVDEVEVGCALEPKRSFQSQPEHLPEEVGLLSMRAGGCYMGSMSGVTLGLIISSAISLFQDEPITMDLSDPPLPRTAGRAAYPPLPLARSYVASYLDRIHRWYAFLDLEALASALDTAYDTRYPTEMAQEFNRFMLFMVFALGASDPPVPSVSADAFTAAEYLRTAIAFLQPVLARNDLDSIRALLLLTVYGLRSWNSDPQCAINVWQVTGHTMRLAGELGITRNSPKWDFGEKEQEARRKVFWSAYGLERYVAATTGRTLSVRSEAIDAPFPQRLDEPIPSSLTTFLQHTPPPLDLRPGVHMVKQRQLLGEILECVYQARPPTRPPPSETATTSRVSQIQANLVTWTEDSFELSAVSTTERDVLQLAFHQATLLLHRPSPSFPSPPPDALDVCMGAARGLTRLVAGALERGEADKVCQGWGGFALVLGAGLALVYCSWIGATCPHAIHPPVFLDPEIAASLAILETLAHRSPQAPRYVALYRRVLSSFESILCAHAMGGGSATSAPPDVEAAFVAAALHNSGFGTLENLDLDAESVLFLSRLLMAGQDEEMR